MFKSERGSVMLVVLIMLVILSVLGMSVLSASIGGGIRSETRENDVQSLHLAEKALNEALAQIKNTLDKAKFSSADDFNTKIKNMVNELKNTNNPFSSGLSEDINYTVEFVDVLGNVILDPAASVGTNPSLFYRLKLSATANVNGTSRTLVQYITIDAFPDFLSYAVGSKGHVIINGSPYIIGNIYAGHEVESAPNDAGLEVSNRAEYMYWGNEQKKITGFPTIGNIVDTPDDDKDDGQLFLTSMSALVGKKCYFEDSASPCDLIHYKSDVDFKENANDFAEIGIDLDKVVIVDPEKFVEIDVGQAFVDKMNEAAGFKVLDYADVSTSNINLLKSKISTLSNFTHSNLVNFNSDINQSILHDGDLKLFGTHSWESDTPNNNSRILDEDGLSFPNKNEGRHWLIVNGNLDIINVIDPEDNVEDHILKINANILVLGHVYISGKVNFDSTIIALNQGVISDLDRAPIQLSDASIGGLEGMSLVLMAKDKIKVTRVNEFEEITNYNNTDADVLKAYFYTEGSAELYGVGSTFRIFGGFFARESLTINALRGNTIENIGIDLVPENNQTSIGPNRARFIVEYNKNVFAQDNGLPRIKVINVKIEPRQLVGN